MSNTISNMDDVIDSRDVIARIDKISTHPKIVSVSL
jgi:hypothetical protein